MKITQTIIALLAAGFLGQSAFGSDNNGSLCLAITPNGHGESHFNYTQSPGQAYADSVALSTSSGGVNSSMAARDGSSSNNGAVKFVVGTNQHGTPNASYIPVDSHFAPAGQ